MSHYVVDRILDTTPREKMLSGVISVVVSALILLLLFWVRIHVPNPPFKEKELELQLDFGIQEVSYGRPTDGGPSTTPPALGGGDGAASDPDPSPNQGGLGAVVTNDQSDADMGLPPIDPPASETPKQNALSQRGINIGQRSGTQNTNGTPNGIQGGTGRNGMGDGGNNGGITGNYGQRVTPNKNGLFNAEGFTSFNIRPGVNKVDADGFGTIKAMVTVDCNGKARVLRINPGGDYNGTLGNDLEVMKYFISKATFEKVENGQCPQTSTFTLTIKREYIINPDGL